MKRQKLEFGVAAIVCAALVATALLSINGSPIEKDAAQNLQLGLTLCHFGVMSLDEAPPYQPSMYREPVPAATTAAAACLADALLGPADAAAYFSGDRAKYLKYQNPFWLVLLWLGVFFSTRFFTGSFWLPLLAGLLAVRPFLDSSAAEGVNDLYTELPAAALMSIASGLAAAAVSRRGARWMLAAGACFGVLTLTKAATLYIFAAMLLALLASYGSVRPLRRIALLALMAGGFLLCVLPWIGRNYATFGKPQISARGGLVLYTRALMDQVSPLEYRGSFYVWARPRVMPYIGSMLGFTAHDLDPGGRLERLSGGPGTAVYAHDRQAETDGRPQDALSFYRQARAERVRLERQFRESGDRFPDLAADGALQKHGMQIVQGDLKSHLALVLPLIWRGAPLLLPFLAVALLYALWLRDLALAVFVLPSVATLAFYALLTHFEPRPSDIAHPVAVATACVLLHRLLRARSSPRRAS